MENEKQSVEGVLGLAKPAESIAEIPAEVQLVCPVHGSLTKGGALKMVFPPVEGSQSPQVFIYCLHCLNGVLLSLQEAGHLAKVKVLSPQEIPEAK